VGDLRKSNFQSIPSNLDEITSKNLIYDGNRSGFSVKGVMVHANKLYVSYTNNVGDVGDPCWNTSILVADFQLNFLQFKPFYAPQDCLDQFGSSFSPFESGGAMSVYRDRWLFLSQGAYRNAENPQKTHSIFGSIIRIDLESPTKTRIVAKGLRNSQGFVISDNTLLFTEQGPMGGDEINQLDLLKSKENFPVNFGWPISSYGAHYNLTKETGYPLYKSHSAYGMMEPLRFYTPSIAVSSIVPNPFKSPSELDSAGYLVGAMGDNLKEGDLSVHYLSYTGRSRQYIEDYWSLPINERIRSMINLHDKLLVSTDSGRLLLIEKD
jgi:glucose/arabinose dehydrogenase